MLTIGPGARRVLRDGWNEEGGPALLLFWCPGLDEGQLCDAVVAVVEDLRTGTGPVGAAPSGGGWELGNVWGPFAVPGGVLISFDLLGLEESGLLELPNALVRGLHAYGV